MSEVDALFRLLQAAPPRSAEIVRRLALQGTSVEALGALFGVDRPRARVLAFRALLDVQSGGRVKLPEAEEAKELERTFSDDTAPLRALWLQFERNGPALEAKLAQAAREYEQSPARKREELLRYLAIALVVALSAFFYWREQQKPKVRLEKRPTVAPQTR